MNREIKNKLSKKLVMTLLARNEEGIIEECIKFHLSQGVDFIIATDNGSTDTTRDVFLKYQKLGVLHLIDEPEHNYQQSKWVDRMIKVAKKQYKADWIINVDADEFWFSAQGNIKLSLPDPRKSNVVFVSVIQVNAIDPVGDKFQVPRDVCGIVSPNFKCLHTAKGYKNNVMGNHNVKMMPFQRRASSTTDMIIFHFHMRSFKHYEQKVIISFKALSNNGGRKITAGSHMVESYKLYEQGKLREFYDKEMVANSDSSQYIKSDNRLYDYINNGYKTANSILFKEFGIYNQKSLKYPVSRFFKRIKERVSKKIEKIKG